jgi:hypothetical protein
MSKLPTSSNDLDEIVARVVALKPKKAAVPLGHFLGDVPMGQLVPPPYVPDRPPLTGPLRMLVH